MRYCIYLLALLCTFGTLLVWSAAAQNEKPLPFPPVRNTQNPRDIPPTPLEALAKIAVPPGFNVTLFAGEPDVQQPIGMCLDDRGRLWVAECYTYSGASGKACWVKDHRDRVLVFEDTDNDGKFDKRTVFHDQLQQLSSVATGFGGVWALAPPNLLFIPNRNGDTKPDGPPEVILDGWVTGSVGHNVVNGLTWGPDGWLYGRHGIQDTSHVGTPGTPPEKRVRVNCSIWRYHPTKKLFEAVTHGTTNPWGFDYDEHGQMFFTNNVNGHFWHIIPGAHFKRMYGEDFNPHLYDLIECHADHLHYEGGKQWHQSRDGKGKDGELGGGHSHVGAMIYLGDNWPQHYRGTLFMCNTHGRRLNNDKIVRTGSGYVATHLPDFMHANQPWFRGLDLKYGPDGGVYVSDWTDLGECHDHDAIHRTSGRIFKITYGKTKPPAIADVAKLNNEELAKLQLHRNHWYVRTARRLLQERAAHGESLEQVHKLMRGYFDEATDAAVKLNAMWTLYVTKGAHPDWLRVQLLARSEHVRVWAIRLLVEQEGADAATRQQLVRMAKDDPSKLVRLFLASTLQRLPLQQRHELAMPLAAHADDWNDPNLPLMLWYGIEQYVVEDVAAGLELAQATPLGRLRRYIARRLTEASPKQPDKLEQLTAVMLKEQDEKRQRDYLQGIKEAMRGWRKAQAPKSWAALHEKLSASKDTTVSQLTREIAVVFGDGRVLAEMRRIVLDGNADGEARRAALRSLIDSRPDDLVPLLHKLLSDRATAALAVRGLATSTDPESPVLILRHLRHLEPPERNDALNTLAARPASAKLLLDALAQGHVLRTELSAYHARQIQSLGVETLNKRLAEVWGEVRTTPAEKRTLITQYKQLLGKERLAKADRPQGRLLYQKHCASCHVLFGEGKLVGPDITGGNRDNLDYLLENIVDPSAVVPNDFRMSVIALKNGRVVTGVVASQAGKTVLVQTQTERLAFERDDIEEIRATPQSLMPDGLLTPLAEQQICDLIAYLMSRQQVPLQSK